MPSTAGFRPGGHSDQQENVLKAEGGTDAPQDYRKAAINKLTIYDMPIFILCHLSGVCPLEHWPQ